MRHTPLLFLVLVGFTGFGAIGYSAPPASSGSTSDTGATTPTKAPVVRGKKPVVSDKTKKIAPSEKKMPDKITRTEEEWKRLLTPAQYQVLRKKGTERPFVNEFDEHFKPGVYACAACGQELFSSETKFNSGCGWPAFYAAKAGDRVQLTPDFALGMTRTEVTCARCGSHLGHIFADAPQTPSGQRYCINSVSLKFIPASGSKKSPAKDDEGAKPKPKTKDASPPADAGKSEPQ